MKAKVTTSLAMALALVSTFLLGTMRWNGIAMTLASRTRVPIPYERFIKMFSAEHKAPFSSKMLATSGQYQIYGRDGLQRARTYASTLPRPEHNIKVNQDHNPWPKINVATAVNPLNGRNFLAVSNDVRQFFSHPFYHVTIDGGKTWIDDTIAGPMNPSTSSAYSFTSDPDAAFDLNNHSLISSVSGNTLMDFQANYANFDTQVNLSIGYQQGIYTANTTTAIDYLPCSGPINSPAASSCQGQLDKAHVMVDTVAGSPTRNRIYVYYTYFCTGSHQGNTLGPCKDGDVTIPARSSAILEAHAEGTGLPFSKPVLVSGSLSQAQFSDMVIDQHGVAHIFFEDFSATPTIKLYESTLFKDTWSVISQPVTTFTYLGMNNPRWSFHDIGTVAPGCAIKHSTAYCAFSASQIESGTTYTTPNVYLAAVDTATGTARVQQVNNDNPRNLKDHFFPWAAVNSKGHIYVGWYDNRDDTPGARVAYFVGKSQDGGRSFPRQQAVSDTRFYPCAGFPSCGYFNDYNQLVIGPDDVVHATWTDTRDGMTQQIYTQSVTW
ncbi:MAG: hypothetical protein J2P37_07845 [Ktedonobacteraceae bacterium]|nr:hypothetical protein [Ktedonobacteraceae bacterium]MBO0790722.1 hypothetical protein [Ktedonobacteraceae bacterium]